MTELLTRREREALAKIREKKWAMLQKALPGISAFISALNKPFLYRYEEIGKHDVIRKKQKIVEGCNVRIAYARIGKAVIVGAESYCSERGDSSPRTRGRRSDQN